MANTRRPRSGGTGDLTTLQSECADAGARQDVVELAGEFSSFGFHLDLVDGDALGRSGGSVLVALGDELNVRIAFVAVDEVAETLERFSSLRVRDHSHS